MTKALDKRAASKTFPLDVVRELDRLEEDLGGRQNIVALLTLAPLNNDLRYILGLLAQPRGQREAKSLAEICAMGNILPGELLRHLGNAAMARGKTLALQRIGMGMAAVADDVMKRAAPYTTPCNTCMVLGVPTGSVVDAPTPEVPNPVPYPCPTCQGTRALLHMPDLERQKLAIEMATLIQKGGGVNIAVSQNNQQNNFGSSGGSGALERIQTITDRILYGDTHEAEIIGDTPTTPEETATP